MRAIKFGPELPLTALQDAQRGIRMNTPPAPNLATPATLCLWITPRGPRRTWLHSYNALLEDHREKEAVNGGRWAAEQSLIFWGIEGGRRRPLCVLGKPPFLLKAKRKGGVSLSELSYWDNYLPSRTIKIQRAIFVSLAAIHSWSRSNYKWIR